MLTRSVEVDSEIQDASREILGSVDSNEAHEKAQLLRMEILLENAYLASAVIATVEKEPDISEDDLLRRVGASGKVVHPEVAESFVRAIGRTRESIDYVTNKFGIKVKSSEEFSLDFYRALIRPDKKGVPVDYVPKGRVVVRTDYPLSVVVEVDDYEDFLKAGGAGAAAHVPTKGLYKDGKLYTACPVIFIYAQGEAESKFLHEKAHAEAMVFKNALIGVTKELIREGNSGKADDLSEDFNDPEISKITGIWGERDRALFWLGDALLEKKYENVEIAAQSVEYERLLRVACSNAKEEIIAYMSENETSAEMLVYLTRLEYSYDYFHQAGIPSDSKLYARLGKAAAEPSV